MSKTDPMAADRYDVERAAKYVRLSKSYLNNMRHFGRGPKFQKDGRRVYYLKSDLDNWLTLRDTKLEAKAAALQETAQKLSRKAKAMRERASAQPTA